MRLEEGEDIGTQRRYSCFKRFMLSFGKGQFFLSWWNRFSEATSGCMAQGLQTHRGFGAKSLAEPQWLGFHSSRCSTTAGGCWLVDAGGRKSVSFGTQLGSKHFLSWNLWKSKKITQVAQLDGGWTDQSCFTGSGNLKMWYCGDWPTLSSLDLTYSKSLKSTNDSRSWMEQFVAGTRGFGGFSR